MEQSDDEHDDNRALKSREMGENDIYHQVECSTEPLQGDRGNTLQEADEA
jgi:hypothetical protein